MIVQDKKLISYARVKLIYATDTRYELGETLEKRINDFIKDKNVYDIQYMTDSCGDCVMIVYQCVRSGKTDNE